MSPGSATPYNAATISSNASGTSMRTMNGRPSGSNHLEPLMTGKGGGSARRQSAGSRIGLPPGHRRAGNAGRAGAGKPPGTGLAAADPMAENWPYRLPASFHRAWKATDNRSPLWRARWPAASGFLRMNRINTMAARYHRYLLGCWYIGGTSIRWELAGLGIPLLQGSVTRQADRKNAQGRRSLITPQHP